MCFFSMFLSTVLLEIKFLLLLFREEAIATSVNALDHYVIRGRDSFTFLFGEFWSGINS